MENLQAVYDWFKMSDKEREREAIKEQVEKYVASGKRIKRQFLPERIDFTVRDRSEAIEFLMR